MSWGTLWFYYVCPQCGKRFKADLTDMGRPEFGACPCCGAAGTWVGETSAPPEEPESYEEVG